MHLFDHDDSFLRPVGLGATSGRKGLRPRQIFSILVVLLLGGGLGTGAYFLSSLDLRQIVGWLDIGDKSPRLAMQMPEKAPPPPGPLLAPPGGAPAVPLPPPAALPSPPAPPVNAAPANAPTAAPSPPPQPVVVSVPPPLVRPADKVPSFAALPALPPAKALPAAPIRALLADSPAGPLPVVAADGRQPWRVYARPFEAPAGRPRLAVVVGDLGLDRAATEAAIARLPPEVSLAFSPYAPDLAGWIRRARNAGHEALVMLPVGTADGDADPGPLGLRSGTAGTDDSAHLDAILAAAPATVGVVAPSDSVDAAPELAPVLAGLLRRGLLYVGVPLTGGRIPPAAAITLVADRDPWPGAIEARLAAGLAAAKARGGAVLLASARPVTLLQLAAFCAGLDAQGVSLAPVSALALPPGKS